MSSRLIQEARAGREWIVPPWERLGLSRIEAAEYVGVTAAMFTQMVAEGDMPQPRRYGSKRIWDRRQVTEAFKELPQAGEVGDADSPYLKPSV